MVNLNYYVLRPKLKDSVFDSSKGVNVTYSTIKVL